MKTPTMDGSSTEKLSQKLLLLQIQIEERKLEKLNISEFEGEKKQGWYEILKEKIVDILQFGLLLFTTFFPTLVPTKQLAAEQGPTPINQSVPVKPQSSPIKLYQQKKALPKPSTLGESSLIKHDTSGSGQVLSAKEKIHQIIGTIKNSPVPFDPVHRKKLIIDELTSLKAEYQGLGSENLKARLLVTKKIKEITQGMQKI